MTARGRILAISLTEKVKENNKYAKKISVAAEIKLLPPNEEQTGLNIKRLLS